MRSKRLAVRWAGIGRPRRSPSCSQRFYEEGRDQDQTKRDLAARARGKVACIDDDAASRAQAELLEVVGELRVEIALAAARPFEVEIELLSRIDDGRCGSHPGCT